MYKKLKQLFEDTRHVRFSKDEKSLLRSALLNHVRKDEAGRQHLYRSTIQPFKQLYKPMPIIIAILLVLGGGTSFAAQNALPGDALYTVKVNVNEEVQGLVTLSDEAKANWETVLATRRLKEAEELGAQSKLNAETRAQLEARFEDHANKAEARIEKLADVDAKAAADIAANLQTSLEAHDRILLNVGTSKDGDVETQIKSLSAKVKAEAQDVSEDRVKSETEVRADVNVQTAAEGRLNAAQNKVTEVQKFIDNKSGELGADATVQAQAQLKVASDLIVQGKAQLDAKAFAQAFTLFGQAHAKAQSVKLLVEAKAHLEDQDSEDKDDVRVSVSPSPHISVSPLPPIKVRGEGELRNEGNSGSGKIRIDL